MEEQPCSIAAVAAVAPEFVADQATALDALVRHFRDQIRPGSLGLLRRVFRHPSIRTRHFALDEEREAFFSEDPDRRIDRFTRWAVGVAGQAGRAALARGGVAAQAVDAVVVNTCTGYICPGVSTYLIETMGLRPAVRAYDLAGAGCGGSIPNLQLGEALLRQLGPEAHVLCISVEICSAALQMGDDPSLIISNALFGDGAGAVVLWRRPAGLKLVASSGRYAPRHRDHIRFVHRQGQLHNQLSTQLPELVAELAPEPVAALLGRHGLQAGSVRHWAVHAGGDKILNALQPRLGLNDRQMAASRWVLENYGNCSSASVWFALDRLAQNGMNPGDWCLILSFGAGMTAQAFLLQMQEGV